MDKASTILFFSSQVALLTRRQSRVLSGTSLARGLLQKRESVALSGSSCSLVPRSTCFPFIHIVPFLPPLVIHPEGLSQMTPRPSHHSIWLYQCIKIHRHSFCKAILFTVPLKYLPRQRDLTDTQGKVQPSFLRITWTSWTCFKFSGIPPHFACFFLWVYDESEGADLGVSFQ